MRRVSLRFTGPFKVTVHDEPAVMPEPHQVLVQTECTAVSPGTELLVYRGEWPEDVPLDDTIDALSGAFRYPLKYGYSAVGRVVDVGRDVTRDWLDRRVFSFNPHESLFLASPENLIRLPESLASEEAAFLPNMETAVSFVMDGRPALGEQAAVFGQGVVGLLTTSLLSRLPLAYLVTLDAYSLRREKSAECGAHAVLDPRESDTVTRLRTMLPEQEPGGPDLVYEISGNPEALQQAMNVAAPNGRIVVGSWYGDKRAHLDMGGNFHRGRLSITSSQVSRMAPCFSGLWTKSRRLRFALNMLEEVRPADLITHRFHISRAADAYALLHEHPEKAIQVIFRYEDVE
ncbi:MAG TPA: zinc-binding dehydrogenase [Desulfomonilaceae bacterium]|nr:zinc-binding dehydrogenase [Desulfomonilaceae bacterium]